jgi:hypothetical protein
MDGINPELRERSYALEQFVRAGQRGTARAVDDSDEIQGLIRRMLRKGPPSFSEVR